MGFAVYHATKMSASGAGLGDHIDRKEGQEHTFQNADPSRRQLNQSFAVTEHCSKPLHTAISDRIAEGYTGTTAIRKDAVRALSLVFTGTHEDMKAIEADPEKLQGWLKANYQFITQEFGKKNVVRLALHLDEKTPHLHAVVVPLVEGKLTAKKLLGNRKDMSARQDRYAKAMEPFGLSRGVRGSKAVHNSEGWYLGQQKQAQEAVLSDLPKLTALDRINPARYEEKLQERFKSVSREKTDTAIELKRRTDQVRHAQASQQKAEQEAARHREATQSMAAQLLQAGKAGITLDSSYALLKAPEAIREAANTLFQEEVRKLAATHLKPGAEAYYRGIYQLEDSSKATREDYERHQKHDSEETRSHIAEEITRIFNQEIQKRWGVALSPEASLYQELRKKAADLVRELAKTILQEVRKALGLEEPRQQRKGRGLGR